MRQNIPTISPAAPRQAARNAASAGFSLIELIMVLAILAVVAGIGFPAMGQFVQSNRVSASVNNVVSAMYSARSAAITQGVNAAVCPSTNAVAVNASCSPGSAWTDGFISFVDDNGNGVRDMGAPAEDLLLQIEPFTAGFTITADGVFTDRVFFGSDGSSVNLAGIPVSGQLLIEYGERPSRVVTISANGRVASKTLD